MKNVKDVVSRIEGLSEDQVIEVAAGHLALRVGIDDPATAAEQVVQALGRPVKEATALTEAVREAVVTEPEKVAELLRMALEHAAKQGDEAGDELAHAVNVAGEKQFVIADDVLIIATLALFGYVAFITGGKAAESEEITREIAKDGRIKITYRRKVTYVSPFSALGQLLKRFWPGSDGSDGDVL